MDTGLNQLEEFVRAEYGLNFNKKQSTLELKTKKRLLELGCNYSEYCTRLLRDACERERLVELLTVHETYFFRENNHLVELCNRVVPELMARVRVAPIRIWSAACSTGEEPYTIAMMMREQLGPLANTIRILATDIDGKTLATATAGVYSKKSFTFRRMPNDYLSRYFDVDGDDVKIRPEIRQMVEFRQLNLFDSTSVLNVPEMDVIFCRNVLIYFDEAGKQKVIQSLTDRLKANGYLFMGHAESIQQPSPFVTIRAPGTFYYRKGEEEHGDLRSFGRR